MVNDIIEKKKVDLSFRKQFDTEPKWLYSQRQSGWENYLNSPLPERASHLWRYSNPNDFLSEISESDYAELQKNANPVPESELSALGIIYSDLKSAVLENPKLVEQHLGKLVSNKFGKIESYNAALWNDGYLLYIPDNVTLDEPILINHHEPESNEFQRILILIGNNSHVSIIDEYASKTKKGNITINSVSEIFIGESSNVKYLNIQNHGDAVKSYFTSRTMIGNDTVFNAVYGCFGGSKIKADTGVILNGRGANSNVAGVIYADSNQKIDFHTKHHHKASESFSNLDFKVILKDKANTAYTGLIRIEKDALNCEAYQVNRNLLLNKGTNSESIPELEILTDQVRCSHGATMGPIDPEMIFYLTSRGFQKPEAVSMVVGGFIEATLKNVPELFKNKINELAAQKLRIEG